MLMKSAAKSIYKPEFLNEIYISTDKPIVFNQKIYY